MIETQIQPDTEPGEPSPRTPSLHAGQPLGAVPPAEPAQGEGPDVPVRPASLATGVDGAGADATPEQAEIRRLRVRLARERAARQEAESVGERATADLYATLQDLRRTQAELIERAQDDQLVIAMMRELRRELDVDLLVERAALGLRRELHLADCRIHIPKGRATTPMARFLERLPITPDGFWLDLADHLTDAVLTDLAGARAIAAVPVTAGSELLGWLVATDTSPRQWSRRDRTVISGVSRDLGTALAQARAFSQQEESLRALRELADAKTEFVSTVSHELRTPLTSILGYLEMMREGGMGPVSAPQAQAIEVIGRNASRLLRLVEDLLTLSSLDSAAHTHAAEPVHLREVVKHAHRSMLPTLARRDLEIVLPDKDVPVVRGDLQSLERVVVNLLSNAVKFTPDGGRVTIGLHADHREVRLTVTDTGIGIPPEEQAQVFERFFRASAAQTEQIQGTGLGLAVCRSILAQHRGTIELESAVGRGTTFTVSLPLTSLDTPA